MVDCIVGRTSAEATTATSMERAVSMEAMQASSAEAHSFPSKLPSICISVEITSTPVEASIYFHEKTGHVMDRSARPGPPSFHMMGRGPARPTNFSYGGPRTGPVHQFFIWWAAARPGPSNFHLMCRGPARPINLLEDGPRLGPAHRIFIFSRPGPARPIKVSFMSTRPGPARDIGGEAHETRTLNGLARHFCGPACEFDGSGHGPAHALSRTKR